MKERGLESSAVLRSGNGNAAGGCVCSAPKRTLPSRTAAHGGEAHPGWFNVGWKYGDGFATDDITAIRVGMEDKWGAAASWVYRRCYAGCLAEGQWLFGRWKSEQRAGSTRKINGTPLPGWRGSGLDGEQGRSV